MEKSSLDRWLDENTALDAKPQNRVLRAGDTYLVAEAERQRVRPQFTGIPGMERFNSSDGRLELYPNGKT